MSSLTVADRFVAKQIKKFPMLFHNRTQVLHYVLCLIGNGYEWTDRGTITYKEPHKSLKSPAVWSYETHMAEAEERYTGIPDSIKEILLDGEKKVGVALQALVDSAEVLACSSGKMNMEFYPQSEYSLLMNQPDGIHPDWKAACDEAKSEAVKHGWKFPD